MNSATVIGRKKPRFKFPPNPDRPAWRPIWEWEDIIANGTKNDCPKPEIGHLSLNVLQHWGVEDQRDLMRELMKQRSSILFFTSTLASIDTSKPSDCSVCGPKQLARQKAAIKTALSEMGPLQRHYDKMFRTARVLFRARLLVTVPMMEAKIDGISGVYCQIRDIAYRAFKAVDPGCLDAFDAYFRPERAKRRHA